MFPVHSTRAHPRRVLAAGLMVSALILAACGGGDASMSCATFAGLGTDAQSDAIGSVSEDMGFSGTVDDVERMRSGAERACAADADQQIGGVVGGFITALAD